jgi:hypothetical protein
MVQKKEGKEAHLFMVTYAYYMLYIYFMLSAIHTKQVEEISFLCAKFW